MTQENKFYRMTLRLPLETHEQIKALAARRGCTMQEIAQTAISDYVTAEEKKLVFSIKQ